jgi:hypothetical protein
MLSEEIAAPFCPIKKHHKPDIAELFLVIAVDILTAS